MRIDRSAVFVLAVSLIVATVLVVGARSIAPPLFDPVGSAALPQACAIGLIVIGIANLIQSHLRSTLGRDVDSLVMRRATVATIGLMAAYLFAMELGLGFVLPTVAFVAAAVPLVSTSWKVIPLGLGLALVLGFGAEWLFTQVFFVDLPVMR